MKTNLKDPKKQLEYLESVKNYEKVWDANATKQMRNFSDVVELPQWISSTHEKTFEKRKNLPVFWPKTVLVRHNVPFDEKKLVPCDGEEELGLFRDKIHGTPTGSAEFADIEGHKASRITQIGSTATAANDTEMAEKWKALSSASHCTNIKHNENGEDVMQIKMVGGRAKDNDNSEDSWDDLLPTSGFARNSDSETPSQDDKDPTTGKSRKKRR